MYMQCPLLTLPLANLQRSPNTNLTQPPNKTCLPSLRPSPHVFRHYLCEQDLVTVPTPSASPTTLARYKPLPWMPLDHLGHNTLPRNVNQCITILVGGWSINTGQHQHATSASFVLLMYGSIVCNLFNA